MDLPLSLCFAAARGDDLLLHQLLKRGSNSNETDKNGRAALHIAASKGSQYCVVLLLEHGADPNIRDSEGNVPLWEAIIGRHEEIAKLLSENGATLSFDTVGHFSCLAVEQNNLDALKDILKYGGDISLPDVNGTTALHRAVSEGNMEIVKFLLEQGADMDKPDVYGWTARGLADHQGHEDIKALFQNQRPVEKKQKFVSGTLEIKPLMKHSSEPVMTHHRSREAMPLIRAVSQRRKLSNFKNSLFGIMSAANTGDEGGASTRCARSEGVDVVYPARVTISGEASSSGKVVKLPNSLEELIEIGGKKLGFLATKILTREGDEIDDIRHIRDGDFLLLLKVS